MTFSVSDFGFGNQTRVTDEARAFPGLTRRTVRSRTYLNTAAAAQSVVITVGTPANTTAYNVTVDNDTVTYTSDGTATEAEIQAGIIAALIANPIYSKFDVDATGGTATVTLTARQTGVDYVVSVSGGGAGYVAANTAAVAAGSLSFGVIVVPSTPAVRGIGGCALPSTTGQRVLGATMATHVTARDSSVDPFYRYNGGDNVGVLAQGTIWLLSEVAITAGDGALFFRHTADGALTNRGYISGVTGTGKDALPGAVAESDSITLSDGVILTEVTLNIPQ